MFRFPRAQLSGIDRRGERASRRQIRQQYRLGWTENRRGLGHEMHAAEDDDIGFGLCRLTAQTERVADEVSDVLDFRTLVVVRQDDGVPCSRQLLDLSGKRGVTISPGSHAVTIRCACHSISSSRGENHFYNVHPVIPFSTARRQRSGERSRPCWFLPSPPLADVTRCP